MNQINNFCDASPIEIKGNTHPTLGPMVSLSQYCGSMSFHHSMKPDQARELAAMLIAEADKLAGAQSGETAERLHPTIAASIAAWTPPTLSEYEQNRRLDADMWADKKADGYWERAKAQAMADQIKSEKTE